MTGRAKGRLELRQRNPGCTNVRFSNKRERALIAMPFVKLRMYEKKIVIDNNEGRQGCLLYVLAQPRETHRKCSSRRKVAEPRKPLSTHMVSAFSPYLLASLRIGVFRAPDQTLGPKAPRPSVLGRG